jgi:hypothetical protein
MYQQINVPELKRMAEFAEETPELPTSTLYLLPPEHYQPNRLAGRNCHYFLMLRWNKE